MSEELRPDGEPTTELPATMWEEDPLPPPSPNPPVMLALEEIGKRYGNVTALDNLFWMPRPGAIHALLGDHMAGKSSLLNILAGFSAPDVGVIRWYGRPVTLPTPADALALGIGITHQIPTLVPTLSVGENILLGTNESVTPLFRRAAFGRIRDLARDYDLPVAPAARPHELTPDEALYAELLRLLFRDLNLLLLDEPFARLRPRAHDAFGETLRRLRDAGKTILFSTSDPALATRYADEIHVLRAGQIVADAPAPDADPRALYREMTGYDAPPTVEHPPAAPGAVLLSTRHLSAMPTLRDVTLDLRRGELLAIVGLPASGQETLAEILLGARPFESGQLFIGSSELPPHQPEQRHPAVAYLPPFGDESTLAPGMNIADNLALTVYRQLARGVLLSDSARHDHARDLLRQYAINATPATPLRDLTPAQRHRLLLARAAAEDAPLLVALYPTRGLALDEALFVRQALLAERERGKAVLLLTDDPQEALALGDKIALLRGGRLEYAPERRSLALLREMLAEEGEAAMG